MYSHLFLCVSFVKIPENFINMLNDGKRQSVHNWGTKHNTFQEILILVLYIYIWLTTIVPALFHVRYIVLYNSPLLFLLLSLLPPQPVFALREELCIDVHYLSVALTGPF
jgi:hypothetical protein